MPSGARALLADRQVPAFLAPRHGLTVGELAQLFREERGLDLELTVVRCDGWRRGILARQAGLPWVFPSPNMPTPETALVGKVIRVNAAARFAVMSFPIGRLPALEQRLSVYRLGLKTGEIKEWAHYAGESAGYVIVEGNELDALKISDIFAPYVKFTSKVLLTIEQCEQVWKSL